MFSWFDILSLLALEFMFAHELTYCQLMDIFDLSLSDGSLVQAIVFVMYC